MSLSLRIRNARPSTVISTLAVGGIGAGIVSQLLTGDASAQSHAPRRYFSGGPAFVSLPLESSEEVNHNTKRLRFKLPQREDVSGLRLTSALLTVSWPQGSWLPAPRPYTPVSPSDEPGYLDLLVKRYPNGKASTHLHSLTPGDKLFFAAAIPGFKWTPNRYKHITLIAGGAGITPIFQLAQGILRNPNDTTAMTLIFGVNGDDDVLLQKELERFSKDFPGRFRAVYTVSKPGAASPHRRGYVDKKLLEEVAPLPRDGDTKVFVCGPPAMETSLVGSRNSGILGQMGYRSDQIHRF